MERALLDAKKGPAHFAEILDGKTYNRAKHKHGVDHHIAMTMCFRKLDIQVHGIPVARRRREERIVAVGDRATPVMREYLTFRKVLELVALRGERKGVEVGITHVSDCTTKLVS